MDCSVRIRVHLIPLELRIPLTVPPRVHHWSLYFMFYGIISCFSPSDTRLLQGAAVAVEKLASAVHDLYLLQAECWRGFQQSQAMESSQCRCHGGRSFNFCVVWSFKETLRAANRQSNQSFSTTATTSSSSSLLSRGGGGGQLARLPANRNRRGRYFGIFKQIF